MKKKIGNTKLVVIVDEADLLDLEMIQLEKMRLKKKDNKHQYKINFALEGFEKADIIIGVTATRSQKLQAGFASIGIPCGKQIVFEALKD